MNVLIINEAYPDRQKWIDHMNKEMKIRTFADKIKGCVDIDQNEIEEWIPILLKEDLSAITIHARTRKEMSKVPADWSTITRAVEIRNKIGSNTLIIGNGDVKNIEEGTERAKETGWDGIMIGRGAIGNPWIFTDYKPTTEDKLKVLIEHTKLFEKLLNPPSGGKNFNIMKKHFKAYVSGFDGSKELRTKLMATKNAKEVEEVIENIKS